MRDSSGFVMPLGALAAAFVTVLVLGTTYNYLQPVSPQPNPDPVNAAVTTGGPVTSAPPATTTTTTTPTVSTAPAAGNGDTGNTTSLAVTAAPGVDQAGQARKPPPLTLVLKGDDVVLQTVYQDLTATINGTDNYPVSGTSTPLRDPGNLATLCLKTQAQAQVKFAIGDDHGQQQGPTTTCFTNLDKRKLVVRVTAAS